MINLNSNVFDESVEFWNIFRSFFRSFKQLLTT